MSLRNRAKKMGAHYLEMRLENFSDEGKGAADVTIGLIIPGPEEGIQASKLIYELYETLSPKAEREDVDV